jgi:hypothetical protein
MTYLYPNALSLNGLALNELAFHCVIYYKTPAHGRSLPLVVAKLFKRYFHFMFSAQHFYSGLKGG